MNTQMYGCLPPNPEVGLEGEGGMQQQQQQVIRYVA